MSPFHKLAREQQRLAILRPMAMAYGRPDLAHLIHLKEKRLQALKSMCRPGDAAYLAGRIGPNDMGEALQDIAWRVRRERNLRRASVVPIRKAA